MVDKIDTSSIPSLFAQVSQGTPQMLEDELLEEADMGWEDGQWTLPEELLVDDDVEKAIYQLGIQELDPDRDISGMMTPYGDGLNEEQIAELVAEYPGIVALAGAEGGAIKDIVDEAGTFEDMNNQEISDAVEEVLNSVTNVGEIEKLPFVINAMGKQIGDAVKEPSVKDGDNGTGVPKISNLLTGIANVLGRGLGALPAVPSYPATEKGLEGIDKIVSGATGVEVGPQVLNKLFESDEDEGYDASPKAMQQEIVRLLTSENPDERVPPEKIIEWIDSGGWETLASGRSGFSADEYRKAIRDVVYGGLDTSKTPATVLGISPEQAAGTGTAGVAKTAAAAKTSKDILDAARTFTSTGDVQGGTKAYDENLQMVFYQAVYAMPGAGRSDISWRLPMLFADTNTMWMLYNGSKILSNYADLRETIAGSQAETDVKSHIATDYHMFLQEYFNDPDGHRTGSRFNQNLQKVNHYLRLSELPMEQRPAMTGEEQRELLWIDTFFNKSPDSRSNRRNLIKMAITRGGQVWYSQQLHKSIEAAMDEQERMGKTGQEIFSLFSDIAQRQEPAGRQPIDIESALEGTAFDDFGIPVDVETPRTMETPYGVLPPTDVIPLPPQQLDVELQEENGVNPWQLFAPGETALAATVLGPDLGTGSGTQTGAVEAMEAWLKSPGQTALTVPIPQPAPPAVKRVPALEGTSFGDFGLPDEVDMGYMLPYGVTEGLVPTHPLLKNQPFSQGQWVNPVSYTP